MNYSNATVLRQEVIKFLYFLQTLAPVQFMSLWQFVQFEDKERWTPVQLVPLVEKMSPQQLEQLMILTSANKRLERSAETRQHIEQLARDLASPVQLLDCFGSMFQMFQFQDLLHSFSYIQLMKFFEVIPSGTHMQQLQVIQQLQQKFGQLTPDALESLHHEVRTNPHLEMHILQQTLHLQPDQFHLYRPIRSLLHMEQAELRTFQDALPKLQPIQILQLLQLLQLQAFEIVELKKVFYQNQSAASIVDPPFEFEPQPFSPQSLNSSFDPTQLGSSIGSNDQQMVETQRPLIGLQIVDQPPEKAVYKRNVKPHPSVQLIGEHLGVREGELLVVPILLRCDTFAEEPRYINGNRPAAITFGRVVTFRKLKVMVTSHQQQETLFSFRFELRRKIGENEYEVLGSVTTNPICMVSHSTQMKPVPASSPLIMEAIPPTGPATGGTRVAILGTNFVESPALRVRFDNTEVFPEFRGPGTLVCHTPQHNPGSVLVRVANGSTAWSEGACTYTYGIVNRMQGTTGTSAVPSYPPAQFNYDTNNNNNALPQSMYGLNFQMDFSGISVGGGMMDKLDDRGYAPLHYAAACGYTEKVRELLAHGAKVYTEDKRGNTPLHWAVAYDQLEIATILLTQCSSSKTQPQDYVNSANACNEAGSTPLHWAAAMGYQPLVALLVEAGGALVNVSDIDGASPLHAGVAAGHLGIVKYLLSRGAFLCSEDDVGETPLHWAIREGHDSIVTALLDSISSSQFTSPPSMEQSHSYTPTGFLVSSQGMTLLPIQAHLNEDGESPLHLAACLGSAPLVSRLLKQGAPPNLRDGTGWTPLHHAAAAGYDSVVRVFIDQAYAGSENGPKGSQVDLNILDWEGNSPLHLACQIANQEIACRLLLAGADGNLRDRQGQTPLQQSRAVGMKVDEFLQNQNKQNDNGQTPKSPTQQEGYFQQFQQLLGANRSPFVKSVMDWLGRTLKGGSGEGVPGGDIAVPDDLTAM